MKNLFIAAAIPVALMSVPVSASAVTVGEVEAVTVKLDTKKLDTSLPASERFEMLERLAERKCDTNGRSITDIRLERACEIELKRSVLTQVGDEALRAVAREHGVL